MSLNIKNETVVALTRELAQRLQTTQVSALEVALREKLVRIDEGAEPDAVRERRAEIDGILERVWRETSGWPSSAELERGLYDADGLPA